MFYESPYTKIEKIVKKAIKKVNKEIKYNRCHLGRYEIRDCYHSITHQENDRYFISYCFEYVDKATLKRKFYGYHKIMLQKTISVDVFTKVLAEHLNDFSTISKMHEKNEDGKRVDYRKVKLDN